MVSTRPISTKCLIWTVALLLPLQAFLGTKTLCGLRLGKCGTPCTQNGFSGKHCCHGPHEPDCNDVAWSCRPPSGHLGRLSASRDDCSPSCWCKRNESPLQLPTSNACRAESLEHLTKSFADVDFRLTRTETCDNQCTTASIESAQVRCALLSRFLI